VHAQARIQVEGEDAGEPRWELIEPERIDGELVPDRGLLVLPEPAEGDLFFDIEGSRYYSDDGKEFGLQYLFGLVNTADRHSSGTPRYAAFWAFDRSGERQAFEDLMDFLSDHLTSYPNAHIYHYNHYEPTSMEHLSELHTTREDVLRRLMGRFATREDEVDSLLRRRLFVDLYRVVRQGIRASVESYSIKRLEPFCRFVRDVPLEDVNERMVLFDASLDEGTAQDDHDTRELIAGYNEDDCRATLALRDWLEERRRDLAQHLDEDLPRPTSIEPLTDTVAPEITALRAELLNGVPEDLERRTPEESARALL
ncbi:MAG: TM0106 family RecB-like putative nuclease, partial [Acidimicrobiia bacterium]